MIGRFLHAHPGFSFDVEEFVLSTKYVSDLQRRYVAFLHEMTGEPSDWSGGRLILDEVQRGACDWVPAYQGYKYTRDFSEWPFTDKSAVRSCPEEYLAVNLSRTDLFLKTTTGSSGPPVPIWHTAPFYFDGLLLTLRKIAFFWGAKEAPTRPIFCISLSDDRAKQQFIAADPVKEVGIYVRAIVDEQRLETYDHVLALINELEPACISSKPSILESLVERAVLKPQFSLRPLDFIVSSGAKLEAGLQVRLEETFGTRAIEAYGMTEFGVVGYPCRQGALHVDMTSTFIEVIDSEGKVLPDGQLGELVVSSLSNRAMPFLRYKTGDLGALETANCACGSLAPRLMKLSGRIIRCLQLPSGRFFPPTYFNDLFVRFPCLKEFQITQIARNTLEILLEPQSGTTVPNNELVDQVHLYVRDSLGEPMSVHVRVVTFRKDCKFERFRTNF